MLTEIRIHGLGVIDDATVPLGPGLNVLTGETGAGKTMVVSALGLLLGERADSGRVRNDADKASVEGLVEIDRQHPAAVRVAEAGGDVEDGVILARTVAESGRSRAFVGGRSAPVSVLSDVGRMLVAVHGQSDQWRLQRPEQHRVVLDAFGGEPVAVLHTTYADLLGHLRAARRDLAELTEQHRARAQRLALLTGALEEIERVDPQPGEDVRLKEEADRLGHVDALQDAARSAQVALAGDDDSPEPGQTSIVELLAQARAAVAPARSVDPELARLDHRIAELAVLTGDVASDLTSYLASLDVDPGRLAEVNDRRARITGLLRTYGDTVDEVLSWSQEAAKESADLAGTDDRIERLREQIEELEPRVAATASALSAERQSAAEALGEQVTAELAHLAMGSARLHVEVRQTEAEEGLRLPDGRRVAAHQHGIDDVEIMLAAGPGMAPRSVAKAASGGELSRVMLALEVVTSAGDLPTFVFDEVDAGIGGAAALDVGARLRALAGQAQVIVVTHLAQVAAYADRHLVVHKQDDGHVTASGVRVVDGADREAELARMLGGDSESKTARRHARELIAGTVEAR